jgi:hypothetical protein
MVAIEEQKLARQAAIESNLRWWRGYLDVSEEQATAHQGLKWVADKRIEAWTGLAERARASIAAIEEARGDLNKPAPAELTRKEAQRILREAGWTLLSTRCWR